ncbi:MAG: type II toxin-antitoxin system RelE/ParE family toxin [Pseudomonadota bacterium]|nr:type II toxin-antitoxin system RelE/ParE family toxin [Pseudomonadota bacterium]
MKPRTVTFRPQAREDVIEIAAYLRSENPRIADAFQEAVETACRLLARLPEIGSAREFGDPRLSGLRMWPIKHFERYLIFYLLVNKKRIDIVRVLHSARDIAGMFEEDNDN